MELKMAENSKNTWGDGHKNEWGYSPVGNIHMLDALQKLDLLRDYLLVLMQDVEPHTYWYAKLIAKQREQYPNAVVILDNGAAEGESFALDTLLLQASEIGANYVVLPDVLGDARKTAQGLATYWKRKKLKDYDIKLMAVVQGKSYPHLEWLVNHYMEEDVYDLIQAWAIPRCQVKDLGSRRYGSSIVGGWTSNHLPIHLLGMSAEASDDLACASVFNAMGIDSANPIVMGLREERINIDPWIHHSRPEDYLTRKWTTDDITACVVYNLETMYDLCHRTESTVK